MGNNPTVSNCHPTYSDGNKYLHIDLVFRKTKDDRKPSLFIEDQCFLKLMDREITRNQNHNWIAPLPFKYSRSFFQSIVIKQWTEQGPWYFFTQGPSETSARYGVMQALLENGHVERAPEPKLNREYYYLPIFSVYYPQKKNRIKLIQLQNIRVFLPNWWSFNSAKSGSFLKFKERHFDISCNC